MTRCHGPRFFPSQLAAFLELSPDRTDAIVRPGSVAVRKAVGYRAGYLRPQACAQSRFPD
jgi:hypothetical protein